MNLIGGRVYGWFRIENKDRAIFKHEFFYLLFNQKKKKKHIIMMLFGAISNSKSAQNNHITNQSLMAICLQFVAEKYIEQQI